jgi:hypothetical protein
VHFVYFWYGLDNLNNYWKAINKYSSRLWNRRGENQDFEPPTQAYCSLLFPCVKTLARRLFGRNLRSELSWNTEAHGRLSRQNDEFPSSTQIFQELSFNGKVFSMIRRSTENYFRVLQLDLRYIWFLSKLLRLGSICWSTTTGVPRRWRINEKWIFKCFSVSFIRTPYNVACF